MLDVVITAQMEQTEDLWGANSWPSPGEWRYEDWLNLPDDGQRYEIIEGVLYVANTPTIDHQYAVMEISGEMRQFVKANKLGYVLTAPFALHLSETTRPVQPDVLFIKTENWPGPGAKHFSGAPDLVVEVLSPSTARTDHVIKFNAYEKAKVAEYWIVNTKSKSVQVYTLSGGGEYALLGEFTGDEIIESEVLKNINMVVSSLFE